MHKHSRDWLFTRFVTIVIGLSVSCPAVSLSDDESQVAKLFDGRGLTITAPVINDRGEVVFAVRDSSEDSENGLWLMQPDGKAKRIVAAETELPGTQVAGTAKLDFHNILINDLGHVIFRASFSSKQIGIWTIDPDGKLEVVAATGEPAPGMDGQTFKYIGSLVGFSTSENPKVDFWATVTDGKEPTEEDNFRGNSWLWTKTRGQQLGLVLADPVDNVPSAISTDRGDVLIDSTGATGVLLQVVTNGARIPLAGFEDPVEISPTETRLLRGVLRPAMNDQRRVVMMARLIDLASNKFSNAVVTYDAEHGIRPLIQDGLKVDGYTLETLNPNVGSQINRQGNVLVYPHQTDVHAAVIFCEHGAEPTIVVASGRNAPGTNVAFESPANVKNGISRLLITSRRWDQLQRVNYPIPFTNFSFNDRNQATFVGVLGGDVTEANDIGIWIADVKRKSMQLVIRAGDALQLGPDDNRTVMCFLLAGAGQAFGAFPRGLNERGQVAYAVQFTDGSGAVILNNSFAVDESVTTVAEKPVAILDLEAARRAYAEWESDANERLTVLNDAKRNSDQFKLETLAQELKEEYQAKQEQLAELLVADESVDAITHQARLNEVTTRVRQLPAIWKALGDWPYQKPVERSTDEDRAFSVKTNLLVSRYGEIPEIRRAIQSKQAELEDASPRSLELIAKEIGRRERVFAFFGRSDGSAKVFDGSLGTLTPGLIREPTMLGEAKVRAADGPIVALRDDFSRLVKLTLGPSGKLELDRAHWADDNGIISRAQAFTMAHELLQKARISDAVLYEEQMRRIGIDLFVRSSSSGNSGVGELFAQLQEAASKKLNNDREMSSGGGGSGDSFRRRFRCESLNALLDSSAKSVTLQLEEQIGPKRVMTVESRGGGSLRVLIESDDEFFLLLQQRNGAVRWISGVDHDTKVDAAENFGVLYRESRSLVETKLIDYLNAYGIMGPVKHTDPQFRATVIERLRAESDEVREAVSNAVERLDADAFAERQDAFKEMARHALLYRQVLQERLADELPVESRARIERLVSFAKEQSGEYDNLIESLDTLDSSEQLTELLTNATQEESTLLNKRLAAISKLPLSVE